MTPSAPWCTASRPRARSCVTWPRSCYRPARRCSRRPIRAGASALRPWPPPPDCRSPPAGGPPSHPERRPVLAPAPPAGAAPAFAPRAGGGVGAGGGGGCPQPPIRCLIVDFRQETVVGLAARVRSGALGARELVQHALDRITKVNDRLNAFVALDPEGAMAAARALDERVARGEEGGTLAGIPIGVKDLEDAAGLPTTHGPKALPHTGAAPRDSILVARLRAQGCLVVGKTNTPELGHYADTVNALFGSTLNPWDLAHSPGGSSGGSAAAIAAGMVPLATGSDGGGSIRIPSSACGLSGFKPSLGRIPSGGPHAPDWHHLSTRGPMARRMPDVVFALDAVIGPDPTDLRSLPMPEPSWMGAVDGAHVPMRVAWSPTLGYAPLDDEVRSVCERGVRAMEELGAQVDEVPCV